MNYRKLREDLKEYYCSAAYSGLSMALAEVIKVERASDKELIRLVRELGSTCLNMRMIDPI